MKYEPRDFNGLEMNIQRNARIFKIEILDRKTIGTVILPIPGGIQDSQSVSWGESR